MVGSIETAVRAEGAFGVILLRGSPFQVRAPVCGDRTVGDAEIFVTRGNGWTEWFTVDPEASYKITRSIGGQESESQIVEGNELINGLAIDGREGGLVLLLKAA